MKIQYDEETDTLYIRFSDAKIAESDEDKPGIILDYDQFEKLVGIEILDASKKTNNPAAISYELSKK